MRFIFGLIFGAVVVLLLAAMIELPTPPKEAAPAEVVAKVSKPASDTTVEQTVPQQTLPAAAVAETAVTPPKPTPKPESNPKADTTSKSESSAAANSAAPLADNQLIAAEQLPAVTHEQPSQQSAVWSPFHSEASAQGFASRLTQQVKHPFRVDKLGPARYAVVYEYINAEQQALLAEKIAVATGAPRP